MLVEVLPDPVSPVARLDLRGRQVLEALEGDAGHAVTDQAVRDLLVLVEVRRVCYGKPIVKHANTGAWQLPSGVNLCSGFPSLASLHAT